ncbi:MAG: hypothetical protein LBR67_01740 [Dysgonamonadaceae bacterium]|jgi:hypothetical protein|nr:hypothetical protein [Dysgonamonadaceae bacterium]
MKNTIFLIGIAIGLCACGSTTYQVGTSSVSIEPTDETISLALAGYAGPALGRFTITWDDLGLLPDAVTLASIDDQLYFANSKGEYATLQNDDPNTAQPAGKVPRILSAVFFHDRLYAITPDGNVLATADPSAKEWANVGRLDGATAIAASGTYLYAVAKNKLWEGTVSDKNIAWQQKGDAQNVISLTGDGEKLFAATADNYLLQRQPNQAEWQRIGYKNGETYTIDVKQVLYARHKLYALAADGHLYRSRHSTEGTMSARAMAIKKGKSTVVIVGADVCGLDYSFTQSIKQEIAEQQGIPAEAIMINASHTHYVPVTQNWQTWGIQCQYPDSTYLNKVVRAGIVRAIQEALDNMLPANLSFAQDTTGIGWNRSLSDDLAIYDNAVQVLQVTSKDQQHKSLLFLTGCHPVYADPSSGHFNISPNFPGYAKDTLQTTGYENSIFLQGCAGDINPKHPFKVSGGMLAADVLRALAKKNVPLSGSISYKTDSICVPIQPWTKEEVVAFRDKNLPLMETAPGGVPSDGHGRDVRWADKMLNYYATNTMPTSMPVYIQVFDIGNWRLIGLSREATTEYGLAIKNLWPEKPVSVIGYTNDVASYLPSDPHIKARDYEGYGSFFWYGQPTQFPEGTLNVVIDKVRNIK